ncbi:hypothetical protein [Bradyrhizobium sp. 172]|uniref:hypothetical protein n=1 Tax=Bradyrhizobium sp. 172 TaxID=2782643 RepID=UPI001FFFC2AD|nr:hypothetical protein [Bradyrhizobium sp. 172]UPJ96406.1 hypothetical protein IVB07_02215 [Bradyrhizobium sp. 172]
MDKDQMPFSVELVKKLTTGQGRLFIAQTADEYATANLIGGHRGASWQFQMLFDAEASLKPKQLRRLRRLLKLARDRRALAATRETGERLSIVKSRMHDPEEFALLFVATMLSRNEFERFVAWGRAAEDMGADELRKDIVAELVEERRPFR